MQTLLRLFSASALCLGLSSAAWALPNLGTTISGPKAAVAGQTVYYYAHTVNTGDTNVPDAVVTVLLAGKPAAASVVVANGTYDASTGLVTFNSQNVAVGVEVTNALSFAVPAGVASETGRAASSSATTTDADPTNNNGSATDANLTTTVTPTGASGTPVCATPGKDESATISTVPNTYYPSTANQTLNIGAPSITVDGSRAGGAADAIAADDLLLIMQMQGAELDFTNSGSYGDGVARGVANGTTATNFTAGQFEYVKVLSVSAGFSAASGGTITLAAPGLANSYQSAAATSTTGQRSFQVVRVPQYKALTLGGNIVPPRWNGSTGGVIALDVTERLAFDSYRLDASGTGFRGGAGRKLEGPGGGAAVDYATSAASPANGTKGEGIAGTPRYLYDNGGVLDTRTAVPGVPTTLSSSLNDGYPGGDNGRGAPGNAGGGGTDGNPTANDQNSGGGGGANGGRGGRGGNTWATNLPLGGEPGAAFPAASSSRLVMGGGGGSGSVNNSPISGTGMECSGVAGGGIILVRAGSVSSTAGGGIQANGADGPLKTSVFDANVPLNDGSGGGGGGGSILLTASNNTAGLANLVLQANGGKGGDNAPTDAHGPGGGGGGGVILTNAAVNAGSTVAAGASGLTDGSYGGTPGPQSFGAEAGTVGVKNVGISNSIANSATGADCTANMLAELTGPSSVPPGAASGDFTAKFSNIGKAIATDVIEKVVLPDGATLTAAQTSALGSATVTTSGTVITITFANLVTRVAGAVNSYTFSYTAPSGTGNITTTAITSAAYEGERTNNNSAQVQVPLPVVLASFTAQAAGADARLDWTTASELHNDHFVVERSRDGRTFAALGTVEGHGTTTQASRYAFTDAGAGRETAGPVYYRLRQVDTGGKVSYSPVRTLSFGKAALYSISLYPNPATLGTTVLDLQALPGGTYRVQVLNATGKVVSEQLRPAGQAYELSVQGLPAGTYLVRVQGADAQQAGIHLTQRLLRQ